MTYHFRSIGGYTSILAGLLFIIAHSLNLGGSKEFGTVLGSTLVVFAHSLIVFSFVGLYEYQKDRNGWLGWYGMIAGIIGTIFVTAVSFVEIAGAGDALVDQVFASPVPNFLRSVFPLLFVIGMILFGLSIIRGKLLPRSGGYALLAGTIIFALGTFAGNAEQIFSLVGAVFTGIGFARLGWFLVKAQ